MSEPNGHPVDELVRRHAAGSFGPGFADRVMSRIEDERRAEVATAIVGGFRWLAAAAALTALALGAWGALGDWSDQQPYTAQLLRGEAPSLESFYEEALVSPLLESGREARR